MSIYIAGKQIDAPPERWTGSPWEWPDVFPKLLPQGPARMEVMADMALYETIVVPYKTPDQPARRAQSASLGSTANSVKKRTGQNYSVVQQYRGIVITRTK